MQQEQPNKIIMLLDRIIGAIFILIFFLIPLFFTNLTIQGISFDKTILFYCLILIGTAVWFIKSAKLGKLELKRTPLDWLILIFTGLFILSTIFSISVKDSILGSYGNSINSLVGLIIIILFYYLLINNLNFQRIKAIFSSLIISGSLVIIYSFLQLLGIFILPFNFTHSINFNPIGSLSGLTIFLIIILPILIIALAQANNIYSKFKKINLTIIKVIMTIVIIIDLIMLISLNGFTFWPAAIVGAVIILFFFLSNIISVAQNNLIPPLAVFFILVIFFIIGNMNLMNLNLPIEVSLSRKASWDIAKSSIVENPILGSGPSTFYYNFSKFKTINFNNSPLWDTRFNNSSGFLFEIASTVGILGALIFSIIIFIILLICFLNLIKIKNIDVHSILLAFFASFITAIIFALLFALSNSIILFLILITIVTAAASFTLYPDRFTNLTLYFNKAKYSLILLIVYLCAGIVIIIFLISGIKIYLADVYVKQILSIPDINQKIFKLNKAIVLFSYAENYYLRLANAYMALANQEALTTKDQAKIENSLRMVIELGQTAYNMNPNNASVSESLALIYENIFLYDPGALTLAENLYKKLIELDPNNPTPNLRIALINMARADIEQGASEKEHYINEAIAQYSQAILKKPNFSLAYYGKAIAYERLDKNDEAIEQLKGAVSFDINNIDYRFELGRLYFNKGVLQQPDLTQKTSKNLVGEPVIDTQRESLSVTANQSPRSIIGRNNNLIAAEQIFLNILRVNQNHANVLYSLTLLYQKVGEKDNAKITLNKLLEVLQNDEETKNRVKEEFKGL